MTPIGSTSSNIRRAIEFTIDRSFSKHFVPGGRSRSVGRRCAAQLIAATVRSGRPVVRVTAGCSVHPESGNVEAMARSTDGGERHGVALTHLDQPLFDGAGVTKGELVDYLDGVADRLVPALRDRPLSVIRTTGDQRPFMQKNVPKYTPDFVPTVRVWAEASKREVSYALCNDRRTLLWFANQRAVEYHPTLMRADRWDRVTHLVLDLDPPEGETFTMAVQAALLVRQALTDSGLAGAVKTSGAKGVHVIV